MAYLTTTSRAQPGHMGDAASDAGLAVGAVINAFGQSQAQAQAQAAAAQALQQQMLVPQTSSMMPILLLGAAGIAAFLFMRRRK